MLSRKTSLIAVVAVAFLAGLAVLGLFRSGSLNTEVVDSRELATSGAAMESSSRFSGLSSLTVAAPPGDPEPLSIAPSQPKVEAREIGEILPGMGPFPADWRQFQPERIFIAPYPDLAIDFERVAVREERGRVIWTGRNTEESASLITVATANHWHAVLTIPGANIFEFHITGGTATVMELPREEEICGHDSVAHGSVTHSHDTGGVEAAGPAMAAAIDNGIHVVDVLFFYDEETLASAQHDPGIIENRMILQIEASNEVLLNSEVVNFVWRFIDAYPVPPYEATGEMSFDLQTISSPTTEVGRFVREKSILLGADQGVLIVGGDREFAGIAHTPGHHSVVLWNMSYSILAHELAHNFNCRHDRETAEVPDGDGNFNYGHRFRDFRNRDFGTIMSYARFIIPHFSNPAVEYLGNATGVAEDQPRAANNARVLREAAPAMAAHREPLTIPVITSQPQAITVNRGQTISLSVTAEGRNLFYQWMRNDVDIPGGGGSVYSKVNASVADSGSYTVDVFNLAGLTTSQAATVTVIDSQPAPSGSGSGGGSSGGSGGGSMNGPFVILLGLLLAARRGR